MTEEARILDSEQAEEDSGENSLRLEIRDSGIGMTAEELSRIFSDFAQANEDTSRRFGGTGLGLVISKRLVESLGGTLTLRENVTLPSLGTVGKAMPALQAWFQSELMLSQSLGANGSLTASNYHPWLKLTETSLEPFTTSFAVMPGTLKATAFSGNINNPSSM